MLLLHGYLSNKESFYYQTKFLSEYYKVTVPDMPGFGASFALDKPYSVGNYCEWLESFIKYTKLERPLVVAHSFGARVAFKYLSEHRGAFEKLVVTGGAGLVKPRSPRYMRRVKAYRRVKKLFPKFAEKHFGSEEYRRLSPVMRESYKLIVNEDLKSCAQKIDIPVMLIYGKGDTVTPPDEEGQTFNSLIAGSRLELIEGGHFCFCQQHEIFNKLIYDFFTEK